MKLSEALAALVRVLDDQHVQFAVVGGLAASARGEARFTRDVDVAVAVSSDSEAEQIVHALVRRGYQLVATVEHDAMHRLATARLRGLDGVVCDLIFSTSGIEQEIVAAAEPLQLLAHLNVPTATTEALLAMKVLSATSQRPRDLGDIQALILVNPDFDQALVETWLALIVRRGYGREQDLLKKWQDLRASLQ